MQISRILRAMARSFFLTLLAVLGIGLIIDSCWAEDRIVNFENAEIGKPIAKWEDQGIRFELAHPPQKSKAIGRITFFPHLGSGNKGIVNAMANEAIPIRITSSEQANKVTLRMWGSTTSSAYLEAFSSDGKSLAKQTLERVPVRKSPEDPIPFFDMTIEAPNIAFIEVGGSKPGGFLAIDELRWHAN